eukprot:COSAG04_NODE_9451_length_863_cov_1.000000_2_plen_21_part_01
MAKLETVTPLPLLSRPKPCGA